MRHLRRGAQLTGFRTLGEDPVPSPDGGLRRAVQHPCRTPPLPEPRSRSVPIRPIWCQPWPVLQ